MGVRFGYVVVPSKNSSFDCTRKPVPVMVSVWVCGSGRPGREFGLTVVIEGVGVGGTEAAKCRTPAAYAYRVSPPLLLIILGSSRNSGKGLTDFEEEVGVVAKAIGGAFDDFDLVVDAFEQAGV